MIIHMDIWFDIIAAVLFIALGGFLSRMTAGGWPSTSCPIPGQWFFALPYGLLFYCFAGAWWALAAYVGAAVGLRQAVYPYFTLGTVSPIDASRVPPLDFLIRPFFGAISPSGGQYWRCVAGLTVEGLVDCIPTGVLYWHFIGHLGGVIVALAGFTRAPSYIIELWLHNRKLIPAGWEGVIGDILRGAFLYGALVLAWVL